MEYRWFPTLPTTEGSHELKVLIYLSALLAGYAYTAGLATWLIAGNTAATTADHVLAALAPTALWCSAWLIGLDRFLGGGPSEPAHFRGPAWWKRAGLATWALGSMASIIYPLAFGGPLLPSVATLASGVVLRCAAAPAGRRLAEGRGVDTASVSLRFPSAEHLIAVGSCCLAIGSSLVFWLSLLIGSSAPGWNARLLSGLHLALFITSVATMACGAFMRGRILHDARVNPDHVRELHALVMNHDGTAPDDEMGRQGIRYAVALPYLLHFPLLFLPLLFLSQVVRNIEEAVGGGRSTFSQLVGTVLALAVVLVTAHYLRQVRAGRHYARVNSIVP